MKILAKIKGLEQVKMKRAGYAIEYDFVDPRELKITLETKKIQSLFLAGQINGTTAVSYTHLTLPTKRIV